MRRKIIVALLLILPIVLFANAYQAFRFVQQEDMIVQLDKMQRELLESNKRCIADISRLGSPERIRKVAEQDPRYTQGYPDSIVYILGGRSD